MGIENRLAGFAAMMCAVMALTACGGDSGGSPPTPPPPPPPPPALTLSSASPNGQAVEGGAPVTLTLTGATSVSGAVAWSMSPAIGTLSGTSATGALYTPPAVGGISAPTVVTITATPTDGSAAALQFTITLMPFGVAGTTPAAGTHVGLSVQPTITFTRPLAAAASASWAALSSPVASVPASAAASGSTLTLTPSTGLVWGGHYTVSLTADISSAVGQQLAPTSFEFDVDAPVWNGPTQLAAPTFTTGTPVVSFDKSGHAFGVWQQDTDGTGTWNIQAARFDFASRSWSTPVALHADAQAQVAPAVAADPAGDAIAVWCENTGNFTYEVYAARFDATLGSWGSAVLIQTVTGQTAQSPQVVVDATGNGTVVWQQYAATGLSLQVYSARFDAGAAAWRSAIELDPGTGAANPQVALDAAGDVVAVWEQGGAAVPQIAAARWSASAGSWSASQLLTTSGLRGSNPQVTAAPGGDATAVWTQTEANSTLTIQAAHFDSGTASWNTPVALSPATGVNGGNWPQAQADAAGNVVVLWQQYQGAGVYSMDAARYDATLARWGASVHVDTLTPANGTNPFGWAPTLVMDAAGNATATWTHDVGNSVYNAFQARYDGHADHWGAAGALSGSVNVADRVYTTTDDHGDVLATWGVRDDFGIQTPWWALLTGS